MRKATTSVRAVGSILVCLLTAAAAPAAASASQARAVLHRPAAHFLQVATRANTVADATYISNRLSNGNRHALLFVTLNWNPHDASTGIRDAVPVGVFYNTRKKRWGIFNEDGSDMTIGTAFNVLIVPRPDKDAFVQTARPANVQGVATYISKDATNRKPGVLLQVTQNWNPPGHGGVPNDHPIGVFYDRRDGEWGIFQEDQAAMPVGPSFNVLVGNGGTSGRGALLKGRAANTASDYVLFRSHRINGKANAEIFATPVYNPGGHGSGEYLDSAIGVWFDNSLSPAIWGVFRQDQAKMPVREGFNLLYYPG